VSPTQWGKRLEEGGSNGMEKDEKYTARTFGTKLLTSGI
jgi:hypothetical protein